MFSIIESGAREIPSSVWEYRWPQQVAGQGRERDSQPEHPPGGFGGFEESNQCPQGKIWMDIIWYIF